MPRGDRRILKADPEDGTTPIANLLLEALSTAKLTSKELAACLFLIRRTYGWLINGHRLKEDEISLSEWVKVLQVRDQTRVSTILRSLEKKGVIKRQTLGPGKSYIYRVNTSIATWDNCINKQLMSEMATLACPKRTRVALSQETTPPDTNLASPKESIKASLNKEDINIDINSLLKPKEAFETWKLVLKELQLQVSKSNYRTWLKGTEGLGYKGDCFVIGVPSGFVAEYLDKNQRSLIEKTLIGITKRKVEVSFVDKKASQAVPCMQGQ